MHKTLSIIQRHPIVHTRYVDDLLLIYDQSKISADKIHNFINHIDVNLEFKISEEIN